MVRVAGESVAIADTRRGVYGVYADTDRSRLRGGIDNCRDRTTAATSIFMASTSRPYAARQNGVVPSMFSRPQFALPQLLYAKYHGCWVSRAFGFAPALSRAAITSR